MEGIDVHQVTGRVIAQLQMTGERNFSHPGKGSHLTECLSGNVGDDKAVERSADLDALTPQLADHRDVIDTDKCPEKLRL